MSSFYPNTVSEWIALFAVLVPLITWSVSGAFSALTYRRDQIRLSWLRLSELTIILYNKNHEHGALAQLAAVRELDNLKVGSADKVVIADAALSYWDGKATPTLVSALKEVKCRHSVSCISRFTKRS